MMRTNSLALDTTAPRDARRLAADAEPLLRQALGEALRGFRADRRVTLRSLAQRANVSPGYISELERGRKEVSSEVLAALCHALETTVADVLIEAAGTMALSAAAQEMAGPHEEGGMGPARPSGRGPTSTFRAQRALVY